MSNATRRTSASSPDTPAVRRRKAALRMVELLEQAYPDARCALNYTSAFDLLVAVVLSAQTTDVAVNQAMPALMRAYPTAAALAAASPEQVEPYLRSIGMYRQKSRFIVELAQKLVADFGGVVPSTSEALQTLSGVGRKTANVVLGEAFGVAQGIAVDTHVQRLSQRIGWSRHTTADEIEADLMRLLPREKWIISSHLLILHGRRVCDARSPACNKCVIASECKHAFRAAGVGRKPSRSR